MRKLFVVLCLLSLGIAGSAHAEKDKSSNLKFVVLRDTDGKPVRNAQVVLHPVKSDAKQKESGELELKTDADGKASVDDIPYGTLRVQVLAPHFQTFGEDYQIDKPDMEITVKLKHPGGQYSTYENHDDASKPQ